MAFQANRSARLLVLSASLLAVPGLTAAALAEAAGSATPAAASNDPVAVAVSLLDAGRLVESQQLLRGVVMNPASPDAQRSKAAEALARVDRRIKSADPLTISLQRSELAMAEGDLAQAERHAAAVAARSASGPSAEAARELLNTIAARRSELAPVLESVLARGVKDFEVGKFADAKSAFAAVQRSGVPLNAAQSRTLADYQVKIVELERRRGELLPESDVGLAMMQPGTVRRPAKPAPAPEPVPAAETRPVAAAAPVSAAEPQPAAESFPPVAATPVAAAASEPAPAPAAEPAPAPLAEPIPAPAAEPVPAPAQDDLITTALRVESQRLIAEGDQALREGRFNEAMDRYRAALNGGRGFLSADEIAQAEKSLAEAEVRLRGSGGGLGERLVGNIALVRERATAEFEAELEQSAKALKAGDAAKARTAASRAQLTVGNAKQYFSPAEMEGFDKRLEDANRAIAEVEESTRAAEATNRERELADRARKAQETLTNEKQKRIEESLSRVRALQAEQKYEEARQVVDQVLFLDPTNPTAQLLADVLDDIMVFRRADLIAARRARSLQELRLQGQESAIPLTRMIEFPADWPAKTFQRGEGGSFVETPENRAALAALERPVPAQFRDNTVEQVVDYIREVARVNVDVDWASLRTVGVEPETTVSLNLHDTPAGIVLERALARVTRDGVGRAGYTVLNGIVTIGSEESLRRHTVSQPYNITDLLLEIPNYTEAPEIDLARILKESKTTDKDSPYDDRRRDKGSGKDREERIGKLIGVIQSTVDPNSWRESGGDVGAIQEMNGSLVITTTPQNHREIAGLLSRLREIRSLQINVESRFLAINSDFFEQIGFDIDIYFNTNNNQIEEARLNDPTIRPSDFFDFGVAPYLRRNVVGNQQPAPPPGNVTLPQGTVPPDRWSPIGVGQNSLGITERLGARGFANEVLGGAPAMGIAGTFLDDIQVDFLIKATQADRRTTTLTAPRLTLTNGQTSFIAVTTQQAFVSDLTPVVGESAVGFDPTVGVVPTGATLSVEGVVSADRRFVTMNVNTSVNQVERFRQIPITAIAGGQLVNPGQASTQIELPIVTVQQIQTTVTVPDEGTILLGGQQIVTEVEVETGVPVLSKIPILNRFFTNRIQSKEQQTLLILLKPTIIINTEEEERSFPGLIDSMRTGLGN